MHKCMYICMHKCMYICMHKCMYICMYMYLPHLGACLHSILEFRIDTYIHTYVRTYIHTHIHTYIHTYIDTCIHTYIHTYTYHIVLCIHTRCSRFLIVPFFESCHFHEVFLCMSSYLGSTACAHHTGYCFHIFVSETARL